jgi:hypothetical protein
MRGIILLVAFIVFGIVIFLLNKFARPKKAVKQEEAPKAEEAKAETTKAETTTTEEEYERPDGCCGAHEVCENESLLATNAKIIYFDDEELDAFKDREPESYTDEEIAQFDEVFMTLRENELVDWLKSLQLRHVPLPECIKEQALMIISERRNNPVHE